MEVQGEWRDVLVSQGKSRKSGFFFAAFLCAGISCAFGLSACAPRLVGTPSGSSASDLAALLSAGGGSGGGSGASTVAPSGLTYAYMQAGYPRNVAIPNNSPTLVAGDGTITYSVAPGLPAGLSLNTSTGVISGTPTANTPSVPAFDNYVVTATNTAGNTTVTLKILVATGYVVNDTADNGAAVDANIGDGLCATAGGTCTLKAAFAEVKSQAQPRTIFVQNGTYNLNTHLVLTGAGPSALTLTGQSEAGVILDGTTSSRLIEIHTTTIALSVSNMTFRNTNSGNAGSAIGAASNVTGTLNLTNVTFNNNTSTYGGAVEFYNMTGTIEGSTFTNNSAQYGGAIDMDTSRTITIRNSTFTGNQCTAGDGGAIWGNVNLDGCTFTNNTSSNLGGAIMHGQLAVTYTNSYFTGNHSTGNGGAVSIYGAPVVTMSNLTFYNNSSNNGAGALWLADGTVGAPHILRNLTFANNSTVTYGGAIALNSNTSMILTHATLFSNSSTDMGRPGGIEISGGTATIRSSLFVGNTNGSGASNCLATSGGSFVRDGYNLSNVASVCTDTVDTAGNLNLVTPPVNNGGPVPTIALNAASTAIGVIPNGNCLLATDARGSVRPSGTGCDAGAFER